MIAYRQYLGSLCRCGQPVERAHHPDMDGYYEVEVVATCHACSALKRHQHQDSKEPVEPVEFFDVIDVRDYAKQPLPPWPPRERTRR